MGYVLVTSVLLAICFCLVGAKEARGRVKREALYIPPLVRPPTRSLADDLPPLVAPRQIFSPRMGKDIDSQLARYSRIPPIPKLDKTFDQYLSQYRRDDSYAYDDDSNSDWLKQLLIAKMRQRPFRGRQPWMVEQPMYDEADDSLLPADRQADKENTKRGMSMLRMGRSAEDEAASRAARPNVRMMRMG